MGLISIDTAEKNTAVLEIGIAKDIFDETVTKIFRSKAGGITVPGFRKGKAPRSIIEKMYGKGMFYDEALNELLPQAVDEAMAESKIKPVSKPEITDVNIDENGAVVKAKYFVKPETEIKDYKGLEATRTVITVSEEDVDKEVETARKRNARSIETADRPAREGDEATIDYEGFIDGVPFDGGKGEGHKLKLGSGQFIPGFEDQIIGKNTGEEFDVCVTFPEDYHGDDVKGKDAVFKVSLNALRYEELPDLDDDFAQDISEFNTMAEYRADVKAKIQEKNNSRSNYAVEEQLVDGLTANVEADIPEIMITNEVDAKYRDYAYSIQSRGMDMDMYMKYMGMNEEAMRAQFKPGAERQVKARLALEKIAELENIEATEEDIDKEYDKLAEIYQMEKDKLKESVDANILKEDVVAKKTVEFIKANANITEVEKTLAEFEEELRKSSLARGAEDDEGYDYEDDDYEYEEDEETED